MCRSMMGLRSLFHQWQITKPLFRQTFLCQRFRKYITGRSRCSRRAQILWSQLALPPNLILTPDYLAGVDIRSRTIQGTEANIAIPSFRDIHMPLASTKEMWLVVDIDLAQAQYFFTRNGKRLEDAYIGFGGTPRTTSPLDLHSISPSSIANLFPTVGATGSCVLHVNFGQSGFVFVEANVKKWGLAPTSGSLVPPPAYGREQGSILLESGIQTQRSTPHLKSSHSRAQIEAAEVLLQIDEDNDARVSRDFRAPTYGFLGSGSGSNFGNMTTTSGKLDGKRSSLLNIIHSAASITPSPPLAPQNFSLSKMNVDLEENSEAELELPIPLTQAPDYQGAQVESEDETPPLISDIIFNPADPDGALGLQ